VIFSSGFSFFKNLPLMLVLLLVLQRFGRRQWGWISELSTEDCTVSLHPINADGTLCGDEVGVKFYPEDKVHWSRTLFGRGTTVVGANRDAEDKSGTIVGEHTEDHGEVGDDGVGVASRKGSEDVQWMEGEVGSARDNNAGTGTTEIYRGIGPGHVVNNGMDEELIEKWRAYY